MSWLAASGLKIMNCQGNKIDFQKFFVELLSQLSEREQEVLKQRYQLTTENESKNTLKKIGDFYGITRERVRQIEREAVDKLIQASKTAPFNQTVLDLNYSLTNFIERKGGVVTQDDLVAEYILENHELDFLHLNAFLFTLEHLVDGLKNIKANDELYDFWQLNQVNFEHVADFINKVAAALTAKSKPLPENDLHEIIENQVIAEIEQEFVNRIIEKHSDLTARSVLINWLAITKKVEKNILNHWGLAEWSDIRPKKLADKIHLIFQRENEPLHFRDVAERINKAGFDHKTICAATVHNELIANSAYVLIGRGIYAMQKWGYSPGTVTEIIVSILAKSRQPLSKEEIYKQVLEQRQVNPSTIYLSLINKEKFEKKGNGFFALK